MAILRISKAAWTFQCARVERKAEIVLETLRLLRNILLRWFVIGAAVGLVQFIVTLAAWSFWTSLASAWWHTDEQQLRTVALNYFMVLRILVVFMLLLPGLAIHWTIRSELSRRA